MVKVLDCTLRDGGYYNDWDFSDALVSDYIRVMNSLPVTHIELGFRFLQNSSHLGAWAYTPSELVRRLPEQPKAKLGVMINAAEFSEETYKEQLAQLFPENDPIDFVRIATHIEETGKALVLASRLHELGYEVGINLMQISEYSIGQIDDFLDTISSSEVSMTYFADSLGALGTNETEVISAHFVSRRGESVGMHAHDNMGMALTNSMVAVRSGVNMLDATVMGMGRGAGNTPLENLLDELGALQLVSLPKDGLAHLSEFMSEHMEPLRARFGWGPSFAYRLAARHRVHPTYVQELLEEGVHGKEIVRVLNELGRKDARRYNKALLAKATEENSGNSYHGASSIQISSELKRRLTRPTLIVAAGSNAQKHFGQLEHLARTNDWTVLALNLAWPDSRLESLFRVGSNTVRHESSWEQFNALPGKRIFARDQGKASASDSIIPKLSVDQNFGASEQGVHCPNELVLAFGLSIALYLKSTELYLCGFDGYSQFDARNAEVEATFRKFTDQHSSVKLTSLTPTPFSVKTISPYWKGGGF